MCSMDDRLTMQTESKKKIDVKRFSLGNFFILNSRSVSWLETQKKNKKEKKSSQY